jgi:hypothetical protein
MSLTFPQKDYLLAVPILVKHLRLRLLLAKELLFWGLL